MHPKNFVLLFFSAPLVGIFFSNETVIPIVRVISFTFLINGFINPGTIYFAKELDFKKQFYWDASRIITDFVAVILLKIEANDKHIIIASKIIFFNF